MNRLPEEARGFSFEPEAIGHAQEWSVHHRGLDYPGELIVAETVDGAWGRRLEGDRCFRLVFFTVPRRISSDLIRDRRVAMAVPRRSLHREWENLGRELRAIREARERYITARDIDAVALRRSMEQREASLHGEQARLFAMSYAQGRIYARLPERIGPGDVFADGSPESWADRLASTVLELAYPRLPIEYGDFPNTLTAARISALYRGLFQGDGDAVDLAQAYGPGLGLTRKGAPAVFDASECTVVDIIRGELESQGGEMPGQDMLDALTHDHGLTRPLAMLFMLAFVRQAHAELALRAGHRVESWGGEPFLADRITWDLAPEVSFSESLALHVDTLRLEPSFAWDAVLPYASQLSGEFAPSPDEQVAAAQQRRLIEVLGRMAPRVAGVREALGLLEASLGQWPPSPLETLDRLQTICTTSDFREFYSAAQEGFGGPSGLAKALDLYGRLKQLADLAPAISRVKRYLGEMLVGSEHRELLVERDSLAGRLEPVSLIASPSVWGSIEDGFQRMRAKYAEAYVSHHGRYRQRALELSHFLERLRPQVHAIARFNEITELGQPVGVEVPVLFDEVDSSFTVCQAEEERLSLEDVPYCQECRLSLDQDVPSRDAELLLGATERAMREYSSRLSSHTVRQILAHPSRELLDKFINLVQVADPSALANVLDEQVVGFLRRLLRNGPPPG